MWTEICMYASISVVLPLQVIQERLGGQQQEDGAVSEGTRTSEKVGFLNFIV